MEILCAPFGHYNIVSYPQDSEDSHSMYLVASFVRASSIYDLSSTLVITVLYAISCYNEQYHDKTWLDCTWVYFLSVPRQDYLGLCYNFIIRLDSTLKLSAYQARPVSTLCYWCLYWYMFRFKYLPYLSVCLYCRRYFCRCFYKFIAAVLTRNFVYSLHFNVFSFSLTLPISTSVTSLTLGRLYLPQMWIMFLMNLQEPTIYSESNRWVSARRT